MKRIPTPQNIFFRRSIHVSVYTQNILPKKNDPEWPFFFPKYSRYYFAQRISLLELTLKYDVEAVVPAHERQDSHEPVPEIFRAPITEPVI